MTNKQIYFHNKKILCEKYVIFGWFVHLINTFVYGWSITEEWIDERTNE